MNGWEYDECVWCSKEEDEFEIYLMSKHIPKTLLHLM